MKKFVVSLFVVACGGAPSPASVTVAAATPSASSETAQPKARPTATTLAVAYEVAAVSGDVHGMALDRTHLYVSVDGKLRVFDGEGHDAKPAPHAWKTGDPVVIVGDGAFDPISFERRTLPTPKTWTCTDYGFSNDGTRMSAYCFDHAAGTDAVHVFDMHTGLELTKLEEFRTAAPIRTGTITSSGNFVFWSARASGAFEEIQSHVTGPLMSSHSVMSPSEDMLFTTVDKNWYSEDATPAKMTSPKSARTLFELGNDVSWVWFSPSGRLFAARHSAKWKQMDTKEEDPRAWITIHAGAAASIGRGACDDAADAAFSKDAALVAVRCASGMITVYAIR